MDKIIINEILKYENLEKVKKLSSFYKTEKGGYGEGDKFLGISVPDLRKIASKYYNKVNLKDISSLVKSDYHEIRLLALFLLIKLFDKEKKAEFKQKYVDFYLDNLKFVNNWDLVDASSYKILGKYSYEFEIKENLTQILSLTKETTNLNNFKKLLSESLKQHKYTKIILNLSSSNRLWDVRTGIVSTLYHIRKNFYDLSILTIENSLNFQHDLINKAIGWILREIYKKDKDYFFNYFNKNYKKFSKTTIRYATEKLEKNEREKYLKKLI